MTTHDRIEAIRRDIMARIERALEAREQAARAALKQDETWYFLRQQLPPPEELEGR